MIGLVEQVGLALMLFIIMLGMGATIRVNHLRMVLARPLPLLIGLISQYGLMPVIALGLAIFFELPTAIAFSLIMVGATPGGTTSNLFTYYAKGDVALSVSMTVASTLAAVVLMPLAIWIYAGGYTSADLQVPFSSIIATLLFVMVPVAIGMVILSKSVAAARRLERASSVVGILLISGLIIKFLIQNREMFLGTPYEVILSAILLGLIGFFFGYMVAWITGLSPVIRRTISMETGIQNTPLTVALISLSFPTGAQQDEMLLLPAFYAFFIVMTAMVVAMVYRAFAKGL
ncbi:bile acid:sodium symporter family protein [Labrenzia sp. PHM005]|uniref:bile acid:sodium symporter family protein n=1 Tax=Labrenzia sp. PHM005 TaxID=2590016 RepID=UPI0011407FE2|nr:bile acid:sodium symporter family protein [Labrenzia sp. PHM005]QDG77065.1 transporter [Labrenzia sp. PHM005]